MSHGVVPDPRRIVLVGFMAAGKSTVGPLLAEKLGWSFVDFDARIREETGRTPGRIIRDEGEAVFRALEASLTEALSNDAEQVLAPGGGWVTRPELADRLGPGTVRVWLRLGPEEVLRRVGRDATDRPLLGPAHGRDARVRRLMREREPLYAVAEHVVDVEGRTPAEVVEEIVERVHPKTGEE